MLDQIIINIVNSMEENEENGEVRYHSPSMDYLRRLFSIEEMAPSMPAMPLFNDDASGEDLIEITEEAAHRAGTSAGAYPLSITIDPGYSFGDGRHATTWLCVKYLAEHLEGIPREKRASLSLLDAGTGTGVLAITAAKLGIRDIDAIDIYDHAIQCAIKNRAVNDCPWIRLHVSDLGAFGGGRAYDIVMANLVSDVITANLEKLITLAAPGGIIIASGISAGRSESMRSLFDRKELRCVDSSHRDGWHGFLLRRVH